MTQVTKSNSSGILQSNHLDKEMLFAEKEEEIKALYANIEKKKEIVRETLEHIRSLKVHIQAKDELICMLKDIVTNSENHKNEFFVSYQKEKEQLLSESLQHQNTNILLKKEIDRLHKETTLQTEKIAEKDRQIETLLKKISESSKLIGEFRASIVYPIYKSTSGFGRTSIGKYVQKLIK